MDLQGDGSYELFFNKQNLLQNKKFILCVNVFEERFEITERSYDKKMI